MPLIAHEKQQMFIAALIRYGFRMPTDCYGKADEEYEDVQAQDQSSHEKKHQPCTIVQGFPGRPSICLARQNLVVIVRNNNYRVQYA